MGCENREGMEELPLDASIGELFAGQDESGPLRYWHDTGHAQLKQEMGVVDHEAMLEANSRWLAGFHLHDVLDGRDHSVPGTGTVDFSMVKRFIRSQVRPCVCPPGLPICACNRKPQLEMVTRKAIVPTDEEQQNNPRARSARLRVAAKVAQ